MTFVAIRDTMVAELMTLEPVCVGARVVDAARLKTDREIHRPVAVDEQGRRVGVLAAMDIVRLVAEA